MRNGYALCAEQGLAAIGALAGVLNRERTGCPTVFLTSLGGGAFGNPAGWIEAAPASACVAVSGFDLDVRLVSYGGGQAKR